MENGSLSGASYYAEPPLSPSFGPALSVVPTANHIPDRAPLPAPAVDLTSGDAAPVSAPGPHHADEPEPNSGPSRPPSLERLLLKYGLLSATQLTDAMREESATGRPLWDIVQDRGWVSREDLVKLAWQSSPNGAGPETNSPASSTVETEQASFVPPAPPAPSAQPSPLQGHAETPPAIEITAPAPIAEHHAVPAAPEAVWTAPAEALPAEPTQLRTVEPAGVSAAETIELGHAPAASAQTPFRVLLRLVNGERLELEVCDSASSAHAHAEGLVRRLASGDESWPYFAGRFVRPESILSIDIDAAL